MSDICEHEVLGDGEGGGIIVTICFWVWNI
jgi:hypothetical protein